MIKAILSRKVLILTRGVAVIGFFCLAAACYVGPNQRVLAEASGITIDNSQIAVPKTTLTDSTIRTGLELVFGLAGGVALVVAVVSGLRFTLTQGDPAAVNRARNSLIFAIVGVVICLTAYSIVAFVLGKL